MEITINCNKCNNTGYILKQNPDNTAVAIECECMLKRKYIALAQKVGLGNSIFDKTFDSFSTADDWQIFIKQTALEFCKQNKQKDFYIGGQVGCGKTHICTAIINNFLNQGKRCQYVIWNDIITRLKQTAYDDKKLYYEYLDQLKFVDVLFIDDFFKNDINSKADLDIAFQIINTRYINSLITIISSERPLIKDSIKSLRDIDEAIASRIYEMTGAGEYNINIAKDPLKNYRFKTKN